MPSITLSNLDYIVAMWQHSDARDTWRLDCHLKRNEITQQQKSVIKLILKYSFRKQFPFITDQK